MLMGNNDINNMNNIDNSIDIIATLSDMKMVDYKNTLALVSLIEVLIEKGIIDKKEIALKAQELDTVTRKVSKVSKLRIN